MKQSLRLGLKGLILAGLSLFAGTAVKRAGLAGLQRTMRNLRDNFTTPSTSEEPPIVRHFIRPSVGKSPQQD